MSAAATREGAARGSRDRQRRGGSLHNASRGTGNGQLTLAERISATWERLVETGAAECPVCAAELIAGRPCASCGSELS